MRFFDKLAQEADAAHGVAMSDQPPVEPSEDEKRNGWTTETLTAYVAERKAGQSLAIDPLSVRRQAEQMPRVQKNGYNPHRWRE